MCRREASARSNASRSPPLSQRLPTSATASCRRPRPSTAGPIGKALAQCGGIYFKLNVFYTDAAVRARVVKPDPKANAEYTKELNEAIKTATRYFEGAERFLIADRGMERSDAVLTYDAQSRAAGERLKSIDAALAAAKTCPALYQSCRETYPKRCAEPLAPAAGH